MDIPHHRLHSQRIAGTPFERAGDVVGWLGAVQAQDYLGALWAVGLRMRSATESGVERALAVRTIVRTRRGSSRPMPAVSRRKVTVAPSPFRPLKKAQEKAFTKAARRYGAFLGLAVAEP